MDIDIAKMAVSIGETTEGIDWGDAIVTFSSVFLGAILAYYCSKLQERHNDKKKQANECVILSNLLDLTFHNIINFKRVYLDDMGKAFKNNDIQETLRTSYEPDCYFDIDVTKYYFLSVYNACFLAELSLLKKIGMTVQEELKDYYQSINEINNHSSTREFERKYKQLEQDFLVLYDDLEYLCVRLYTIQKMLLTGIEKYFNTNSYEDIVGNFEKIVNIGSLIKNPEALELTNKMEKEFEIYWMLKPNFFCILCFLWRKIKQISGSFKKYFIKPTICQNCRCCKIKCEKK